MKRICGVFNVKEIIKLMHAHLLKEIIESRHVHMLRKLFEQIHAQC